MKRLLMALLLSSLLGACSSGSSDDELVTAGAAAGSGGTSGTGGAGGGSGGNAGAGGAGGSGGGSGSAGAGGTGAVAGTGGAGGSAGSGETGGSGGLAGAGGSGGAGGTAGSGGAGATAGSGGAGGAGGSGGAGGLAGAGGSAGTGGAGGEAGAGGTGGISGPIAQITTDHITLTNGLIERRWSRAPFRTQHLRDLRTGREWTANSADFSLIIAGIEISSDLFEVSGTPLVEQKTDGTLRLTLSLAPPALAALPLGLTFTRAIEIYPGIAGLRQETWLNSPLPLPLSGYVLDQAQPSGSGLTAQMHSFRAGADWREPEWAGPPLVVGDPHAGSWRKSTAGSEVSGTAQWLSVGDAQGQRLFYVLERNDYASSQMRFSAGRAQAAVDFSRDILYLGPLEEQGHVENPTPLPAPRLRIVLPGTPLRLEPVFTGVALNADDEPWQHYKYLATHRMPPYRREITFNSNGVDDNRISTGAKDDVDFAEVQRQGTIAKQLGVETFILDDGWQARSGDWCPDAVSDDPACHEPRRGTDPKFAPRFPDTTFTAVRQEIAPMQLGLWMSPMHFNPNALAFQQNPQWLCAPIGVALLALNLADPEGGSSDAGIVQWNPEALAPDGTRNIDYIESRIRRAIDQWGVKYFKFDFTAWLDCVGVFPVDMYGYRESFMAMLDRVIADHPDVTIQMDETNDYRLFPFEAIARGPMWYQNGSPTPNEALHANFLLAPYVPLYALGRNALRAGALDEYSVDYQMAVALLSHMTFFNDLRDIPDAAIPRIRVWTDYFKAHRQDFAALVYPLLDDDPFNAANWAAFQAWDPEVGRGALLVYRQDSAEASRTIRLRNLSQGTYRLLAAPDEAASVNYTAAELSAGVEVALPAIRTAAVFRIEQVQ